MTNSRYEHLPMEDRATILFELECQCCADNADEEQRLWNSVPLQTTTAPDSRFLRRHRALHKFAFAWAVERWRIQAMYNYSYGMLLLTRYKAHRGTNDEHEGATEKWKKWRTVAAGFAADLLAIEKGLDELAEAHSFSADSIRKMFATAENLLPPKGTPVNEDTLADIRLLQSLFSDHDCPTSTDDV